METSLHHQLKSHYAASPDQIEVTIGAYRIDVVRGGELEIPIIDVDQHRWVRQAKTRRRRDPGYVVEDTELTRVHASIELRAPADLWKLLPAEVAAQSALPASLVSAEFNTHDLATAVGCPRWIAQRIAYVMRHSGAIQPTSRDKSGVRYRA